MKISRRNFIGFSALTALSGGGYSFFVEPKWLRLRQYELLTSKWPETGKPLKIAFASDFHIGCPSVGLEELDHIVQKLNELQADVVLLGGDFLIQGVLLGQYISHELIAQSLSKIKSPLGIYTVLGNHDWWGDGAGLWKSLENVGIKVLENSSLKITKDNYNFWIAGLADDTTRDPDYQKTMAAVNDSAPVILLAHDPASYMDVDERPVVTLCGHTHGGQVTIPYISPIIIPGRAPLKYAYGHIQEEGRDLIVTGGIGTSILPVRFGRRPEIVSIEIRHGGEGRT